MPGDVVATPAAWPRPAWDQRAWRQSAACREADPSLFFPAGTTTPELSSTDRAKAICARCPVREECLTFAVATNQEFGVWGGRDEDERRRIRRRWKAATRRRPAR